MPIDQIHPMIVHFPIVLALVALAFDFWSLVCRPASTGGPVQLRTGTVLLTLGALAAIVAFIFGDMAFDIAMSKGANQAALETHEGWGTTTMIVFVIVALLRLFMWWRHMDEKPSGRVIAIGSSAIIAVMVVVTAYFGGHLVYDLGVNIGAAH